MLLVIAVGEVEADDVDAGLDEALQDRRSREAGPTVATIFVRRIVSREYTTASKTRGLLDLGPATTL